MLQWIFNFETSGQLWFKRQNVWNPAEMWGMPSQLFVPTAGYYVTLVAPKIKKKK